MEQKRQDSGILVPLLKLAVFTLLVPATVAVWLPRLLYPRMMQWAAMQTDGGGVAGLLLVTLGATGYFWCAGDFVFAGQGTPAPIDHPKVLVTRGLYRYVRNPMYISVLLVLLGECILFRSWALLRYTSFWFAIVFFFVFLYEEPTLRHKFGASYEEYCRTVPRWFPRRRSRRL